LEKIIINTGDSVSAIMVGARWEAVIKLLPDTGVVILTDDNVREIYGKGFPPFPVISIRPGEESKQLKTVESLCRKLLKKGLDRTGFILAIGGGVVCDIAGFLSSVYLRGIRCGYVSTSLLSQVDASTGGKTGVNLGKVKNIIGTFSQPEFVICDTTMLRTLADDEYSSGLAELIKTGIIGDSELFELVENNVTGILKRDRYLMARLVARSVKFKGSVVAEDERESDLRRILNFGHTFGHAFELYLSVKHGFAVAAGIEIATAFSQKKGYLSIDEEKRIADVLKRYKLTSQLNIPVSAMENLIMHDKKKSGNDIHFVFTAGIGKALTVKVPAGELIEFYKSFISVK
jgi:3-dehydroquinate synthase